MDGSHGRLVLHLNIRAASSCEGYGLHWNAASSTLVAVCVNVLRLPLQRVGGSAQGGGSALCSGFLPVCTLFSATMEEGRGGMG